MKTAAFLALVPGVLCMAALAQDPHADHAQPPPAPATSTPNDADAESLPVGNAPPPAVIKDNVADRFYPASSMARARDILNSEHGGGALSKIMADILEATKSSGDAGFRWNVKGRYGGDLNRFEFKSEGEAPGGDVESAEVRALYSRAVARYTDVQAGVRYDFEPDGIAYATVGVETLLPYWFDVEGAVFLSEQGDSFARLEGSYDLQVTQRLIVQPRVELTLAAQDVPEANIGSGICVAEIGLRLRYDIRREFSPYIGVNFERRLGRTRDMVRASGGETDETSVLVGLRAWF